MQSIKLEVPATPEYIRASAAFFNELNGATPAKIEPPRADLDADAEKMAEDIKNNNGKELSPGVTEITKDEPTLNIPAPGGELDIPAPGGEVDPGSVFSGTGEADEVPVVDQSIERDAAGFPWDARIHSGNKKKYSDGPAKGAWFRRRGVTPEITNQVEAELLESGQAIDPEAVQASPEPTLDIPAPGATTEAPLDIPAPGATTEERAVSNFPELMALVQVLKGAGQITDDQLNEQAVAVAGVPNVALMATKLDLIPALGAAIQAVASL